jgi:hypothetical protein
MRSLIRVTLSVCLSLVISCAYAATELTNWPPQAAEQLNALIAKHANKGEYAVFDMDNTSYQFDLEEGSSPKCGVKTKRRRAAC